MASNNCAMSRSGVGCHDGEAQTALALGYGGGAYAVEVDAAVVEVFGYFNGFLGVANAYGYDVGLRLGEVEAEFSEMLTDGFCVVPQALAQAGIALDEVERRGGGCTCVGRHGSGVDVRCRAVADEVDEVAVATDETAGCAEGFAARGHENVDGFGREAVVFEGAAAMGAEDAGCVGVIDHQDGVVLFGEGYEVGQWGDVSVH